MSEHFEHELNLEFIKEWAANNPPDSFAQHQTHEVLAWLIREVEAAHTINERQRAVIQSLSDAGADEVQIRKILYEDGVLLADLQHPFAVRALAASFMDSLAKQPCDNYIEMELRPTAGSPHYEQLRVHVCITKPGKRSPHEFRRELEGVVETQKQLIDDLSQRLSPKEDKVKAAFDAVARMLRTDGHPGLTHTIEEWMEAVNKDSDSFELSASAIEMLYLLGHGKESLTSLEHSGN